MIDELRGKRPKKNETSYKLEKNSPIVLDKNYNSYKGLLEETRSKEGVSERLYIESIIHDEAFALVASEYSLNMFKSPKAPDFSYYYFGTNNKLRVYIYDMKKTLAGEDVIIHLIEQWIMGISTAKSCEILLNTRSRYKLYEREIQIGVITENNDAERRKRDVCKLESEKEISEAVPSFVKSMRKADNASNIKRLKLLREFEMGYIEHDGIRYRFDIRLFVGSEYSMHFEDGQLARE